MISKHLMKVIINTLLLFLLVSIAISKPISLEELSQLDSNSLQDSQLVQVVHSSEADLHHDVSREYYVMKVTDRNKRNAYENMKMLYERVVRILKRFKLIPHQGSLVKSKTKPQYLSKKRKWSFSTMFVLLGKQAELKQCYTHLARYGIQKLNARPSINYLNQKIRALETFAGAKAKLEQQLKRFSGFYIKQIEKIDFDGIDLPNSDLIERQIEEEFSHSEQNMDEDKLKDEIQREEKSIINLRVLFEVSNQEQQGDSILDIEDDADDDDQDDESIDTEQDDTEQDDSI